MTEPLVDVNVTVGPWPTRRVAGDTAEALARVLRTHGVTEAWAGSFAGAFHADLAAANARLAEDCRRQRDVALAPFGTIDPARAGWEQELRNCVERHGMRGVRLLPGYHGYALSHPEVGRLLRAAAERRVVTAIVASLEDERMMQPLLKAPAVDFGPLAPIVAATPGVRLLVLNGLRGGGRGPALDRLAASGAVSVEIATLEGVGGVERLLLDFPTERVLFGSHAPYLYFEAARLKLVESRLDAGQLDALRWKNARRLLSGV